MYPEFEKIKIKLSSLRANDHIDCLNKVEQDHDIKQLRPLKVAVLRNYTVEPLEPFLRLRFILEGYNPQFSYGGYGQHVQEALDEKSFLYAFKPDIILFLLRSADLLPEFYNEYNTKTPAQWQQAIDPITGQLAACVAVIRKKLDARIFVQNMGFEGLPYWGVYDAQQPQSQVETIAEFNRQLATCLRPIANTFIWDYSHFISRKGYETLFDPKMWYISRNPFKYSAYPEIIDDLFRYVASAMGKVKKCIVLDLDNTLWGGVIGEDGFERIQLGEDYPGACYRDMQKDLLKLYHRGILLAINSKNNEDEAFEVIDKHPGMVLRRKHFAAHRINWKDKAANLEELAEELNIGIDSIIFIDDNPRECELIRQLHPECVVVELPEKRYQLASTIQALLGVENINITDEDKKKGEIYQSQVERKKIQQTACSLEEYLRSLALVVSIKEADSFTVPRIAQLTQKTNQMNLATRRYSEAEIESFMKSPLSSVFYVSVKDRLGDHGIVGVMILKIEDDQCLIDTFLLSCRVLGLTIEQSMLAYIQEKARESGCRKLIGEYIPTKKNTPAAGLYEAANFEKQSDSSFVFDLKSKDILLSPFITLGVSES